MEPTYWHRQEPGKLLYPELEWSRPENRRSAGKLLIAGGNAHGFSAPALAYQIAEKAGVGTARVLLPDALQKSLGRHIETAEFTPSTPSGSFSKSALADFIEHTSWADGVLLAGDFGRNSETAILLESYMEKTRVKTVITRDAVDYFLPTPELLLAKQGCLIVASFAQLQKLATAAKFPKAFTFSMDLLKLIDALHEFSRTYPCAIMVKHLDTIVITDAGEVSTTRLRHEKPIWRVEHAARAAVWWIQHTEKRFEALTTSVVID